MKAWKYVLLCLAMSSFASAQAALDDEKVCWALVEGFDVVDSALITRLDVAQGSHKLEVELSIHSLSGTDPSFTFEDIRKIASKTRVKILNRTQGTAETSPLVVRGNKKPLIAFLAELRILSVAVGAPVLQSAKLFSPPSTASR